MASRRYPKKRFRAEKEFDHILNKLDVSLMQVAVDLDVNYSSFYFWLRTGKMPLHISKKILAMTSIDDG